jgi:hypothetical protein
MKPMLETGNLQVSLWRCQKANNESLRFTPVRAGIKPAPTGELRNKSHPTVGATLVVARVGGHFSTMRVGFLNNLFCRLAQAKSPMLETGKTIGRVDKAHRDIHKLVGIAHPTRLTRLKATQLEARGDL